jgi:hypothetical protein
VLDHASIPFHYCWRVTGSAGLIQLPDPGSFASIVSTRSDVPTSAATGDTKLAVRNQRLDAGSQAMRCNFPRADFAVEQCRSGVLLKNTAVPMVSLPQFYTLPSI